MSNNNAGRERINKPWNNALFHGIIKTFQRLIENCGISAQSASCKCDRARKRNPAAHSAGKFSYGKIFKSV